jgi:predicted RNA polymerase sigma factor
MGRQGASLSAAGDLDQARAAYSSAIELSLDVAQRAYLIKQRSALT